jgi:hypothetical protein
MITSGASDKYQRVDSDSVSEASNNDADLSGNGDQRCVPVSSEVSGWLCLWCNLDFFFYRSRKRFTYFLLSGKNLFTLEG